MGNLKPIDSALVKDVDYDLISPDTVGGEYIETIGAACENPDGYTSGSLFLGRENGVQHLYRATAAIAFGETIILDTNCAYTTVSGELEGKAEESEVTSLNEALTNEVSTRSTNGAHNLLQNKGTTQTYNDGKLTLQVNSSTGTITAQTSATTTAVSNAVVNTELSLPNGNYILSDNLNDANFYLLASAYNGNTWIKNFGDTANGDLSFVVDNNGYNIIRIYVTVKSGSTYATPKTMYPMIRLATDADPTYTPYAMTNRELTEDVSPLLNFLPGDSIDAPNLDNFNDTGFFSVNNATNKPSGTSLRGVVINIKASNSSSYLVQLYLALYSTDATKLFVRNKYEGTWNSWTQIQ